ncbi:glycosyltransferase family 2 protein [Botryobasidium botryosum FD-172 SS1]|uniref:chitin synthase n=1 Tax=Botryobasidium botryosum (strain FD-172 SS1) TaxID=930990 RepID=A0A067MGD2_BOTB1|nr:glycosyltransferase family 2 protein [Botryobasidium botryosum FD-172 SS1]
MSGPSSHKASGSTSHPNFLDLRDLAKLPSISDDIIVACIRDRFYSDMIYTSIGPSAIVAVNPHRYVTSNADSVLMQYASEYRDTSEDKIYRAPHVFQLTNNAYYRMRRTGQDQCILFSGETGSGKSESRRLAIKSILELSVSNPGKKGSKLSSQIPSAEFVIETFGNARTLLNPNASRFGKYTELQFTERGRLCGIKTLDYYLERNRVAGAPSGERNFHIFYYLVAGASLEERQHLQLNDKTPYRYLGARYGNGPRPEGRDEDSLRFEQLKHALKSIGLSKRNVAQTCQLIAAILHLGNLEFIRDRSRNEDAAVVRNTEVLAIVADFLGVQPRTLESVLSYKTKLLKKELCTVFLDPEGASDNRDDLAKTLYSLLFAWLNESINSRLCREDYASFIGLFDLPGTQNVGQSASRANSLDQFCVNFANERLQNFIQRHMFEAHVDEYAAEGIARYVPTVPYFDNSECIRMLSNKQGGLIHIMDDQARRIPKKTDHSMVEAFGKRWGNHASFKLGSMDRSGFPTFIVNHFNGPVTYSAESFLDRNVDAVNPDFVSLLRGSSLAGPENLTTAPESTGSANPFVRALFSAKVIATQAHPQNEDTIVAAQQPVKPMRAPSTRRKLSVKRRPTVTRSLSMATPDVIVEEEPEDEGPAAALSIRCVAGEFRSALDTLFDTLEETHVSYVFCLNPNDSQMPAQLETRGAKAQVRNMGIPEMARRSGVVFEVSMTPEEFCERYRDQLNSLGIMESMEHGEQIETARTALGLGEEEVVQGQFKVFLSQLAFHKLEDHLRASDVEEQKRNRMREAEAEAGLEPRAFDQYAPYSTTENGHMDMPSPGGNGSFYGDAFGASSQALPLVANAQPFLRAEDYPDAYDDQKSFRSDDSHSRFTGREETQSNFGSESYAPSRNMFHNTDKKAVEEKDPLPGEILEGEVAEEIKDSPARRKWVFAVWMLTFWLPTPFLTWFGRMKRMDVRQAWREKLAINIMIWFMCLCTTFVIIVLGDLICPHEYIFSTTELQDHGSTAKQSYVSIRGEVFDLTGITQMHISNVFVVPSKSIMKYAGTSVDTLFPIQPSALCDGWNGPVSPYIPVSSVNTTNTDAQYHDFRVFTSDPRPDWYFEQMTIMRWKYRVGFLGFTSKEIKNKAATNLLGVYNSLVYDITDYVRSPPTPKAPPGYQLPGGIATDYLHPAIVDLFKYNSGQDITKQLDSLPNIDPAVLAAQKTCLRNIFLTGKVDNRESPQCLFSTNILLAISIMMVSIIGFKFIGALHFGAPRAPEDHDKFVICQVPCYTEGEESLRRTIDSLAQLKYDDKRKLLFVICDGMVVGSGNDRPTPRIVLDILGSDPNQDPEPLSFLSLGEGSKQHNMGKVYSGLYECGGHVVPYIVLVKVGKPTERSRPGNRGKRDSQMSLMHFLNKVHFNSPMNPLELEMYHQIKNVIGVNPTFYEYIFMVDADTTVEPLSLNRLVSAMMHDKRVIGVCGETSLSNAKHSIITMMQVYEYFISHHLAKAFESLFGSVTCLPGCFTMYRLRTPDTHKPLFIANQIIQDYSENRVDTLHMKNLLHLGEDRYLTTLLLKHFPNFKTQFVRDAHAFTVAPDDWSVLLSQRRRWINSTVHNLAELVFLDRLCGFCCFSMRFIVFIDLLSTLVQPVTVAYIGYLIYIVVAEGKPIPQLAIIMLAVIYGLQALVFVFRRKWDMIGWMVFYILAIPAFSFLLPLYSFWKMDDFSWGATRVVLGESGKKLIVHDEGKFDPRSIPLKSWNDYENELWDKESNHSIGSWVPPPKSKEGYESRTASLYGRETYYDPNVMPVPRAFSPAPSYNALGVPGSLHGHGNGSGGMNTPTRQSYFQNDYAEPARPAPSRPVTNYLGDVLSTGSFNNTPEYIGSPPGVPSEAEIERAVQDILKDADLNSITKREIRRRLEEIFNTDLNSRKTEINAVVDKILLSEG